MPDMEKVIKGIRKCLSHKPCGENGCPYEDECAVEHLNDPLLRDAITLLKEHSSLIGTRVTADGITFISTGTAQDGEARGLLLGKMTMHEWLKKELFYRGLLTDEIRAVFDEAKRRETK